MESELKDYISWYRRERQKFCQEVYTDKSNWLKKKLLPYPNWDDQKILTKESEFALNSLINLQSKKLNANMISLAQLTLSNRIEYISDHADFYVTYAGLIIFTLTIIGMAIPFTFMLLVGAIILAGVAYCVSQRITLRRELAISKEIINIFKQYESKHLCQQLKT